MKKYRDVIGVENLMMDFAVQLDRIPETDSLSWMQDYLWQGGGNASTAIVTLARLGARCGMLGVVGSDAFGQFCRDDMIYHNVDVSHLFTQNGPSNFSICLVEEQTGGRSFIVRLGVNEPLDETQADEAYIASAKYIHISMLECSARDMAIHYAKKNGVLVSLDAGWYNPEAEDMINKSDILIMSHDFYAALFDGGKNHSYDQIRENCKSLLKRGPQVVVATLGRQGCAGADKHGSFYLPAFSGYPIVDTTGAGDVYHGGFLYAHNQGWELASCAKFASAVSIINSTCLGGRVGLPTLEDVEEFLANGVICYSGTEERRKSYRDMVRFEFKTPGIR